MPMAQPRDADARMPKGVYANYFEVGHTAFEIVIDFGERWTSPTSM